MCVGLETVALIAAVTSAGVGAYANIQRGNSEYAAGMYNAQIADRNAQNVENEKANVQDAAAIERRRLGERIRAERGEMIAKYGAMGLDAEFGTPADLIGDVTRAYDIDRSILGKNELTQLGRLDQQQADYRDSAALSHSSAKSARKGSQLAALGSLLDGASTVAGRWIQPKAGAAPIAAPNQPPLTPLPPHKTPALLPIG